VDIFPELNDAVATIEAELLFFRLTDLTKFGATIPQ